jgi:hypothetical protein
MDNNLDATRLNPYGNANMQKKREMMPPSPAEPCTTQKHGMGAGFAAPMAGMPSPTGYPTTAGAQTGFPTTAGFPTVTGFPAPGAYVPPQQTTGFPAMPGMNGATGGLTPIAPFDQPIPITTENILFLNAFLKNFIGRRVTIEFLIGTNTLTDRTGTLLAVGANYIVINEVESDDVLVCDFFSIKFVKVYY